jgi:CubicO group peptidase (beta-lactamase class C family)
MLRILLAAILLLSARPLCAQTEERVFREIDNYIAATAPEWQVPGFAIAIVYGNRIVHTQAFGYRDYERKIPVTPHTLFRIASITKSFTALSCAMLHEENRLDLDRPILDYMPDFRLYNEDLTTHTTTRDLLTHRTGLPRHDPLTFCSDFSMPEIYRRLRYLEPSRPLRSTFQYSNLMYMLAGMVVEKQGGLPWNRYVQENILSPLGMTGTCIGREAENVGDRALPYTTDSAGIARVESPFDKNFANASADISSTVLDMGNYLIALLNGGSFNGRQVIPPQAIAACFTPNILTGEGLKYPEIYYEAYGLGWYVNAYRGHLRIEHGGNLDGFSASACMLPGDSIGVIILTNTDEMGFTYVARNYIVDRLLNMPPVDWNSRMHINVDRNEREDDEEEKQAEAAKQPSTSPSAPLATFAGTYENPAYGSIRILVRNARLYFSFNDKVNGPLTHYHYDTFYGELPQNDHTTFNFVRNSAGEIVMLGIPLEEALHHDIEFTKID